MGIFSLKWFRSQKESELEALKVEEQKIKNDILSKELEEKKSTLKPYLNIKLVNDVLTIVLRDGNILSKTGSTINEYIRARESLTEIELYSIINTSNGIKERVEYEKELKRTQYVIKGIDILKNNADFNVIGDSVYIKGVKRSLPNLLVERFAEIASRLEDMPFGDEDLIEQYEALKKFWLKCCLNPNAQSAEDLYIFLDNHQFKIDNHGNFYAYRRVCSVGEKNKELVKFVSNAYTKVKAVWKKKPQNYFVHEDDNGDYKFSTDQYTVYNDVGNLHDLYVDLPNLQENRYTSKHTGREDYRVGEVISMPRNEGDDSNQVSCSKGFHAASKEYDYSGFGDVPILVIINPIDVLSVPKGEVGKLRTCRWFFAMTLTEDEQYILDEEDFDVSELGDIFEEKCMTNLENYVQNSFAEEVKRHTFTLPSITGKELSNIVLSLEEMKGVISTRVVNE